MTEQTKIAVKGIYSALAAAQMEMGPALKDRENPAFKQKYAELSNVIEACLPALNRHGICVLQPICDEDGKRYVKTVLAHESGETIECRVELIVGKNDMQGLGSAITYGRRYGLMAMAGIAPEDDDGNAVKSGPMIEALAVEPRQIEADAYVSAEQADAIIAKAFQADVSLEKISAYIGAQNVQAIWAKDFSAVMKKLDATIAAKPKPANADLAGDALPY